MDCAIVFIFRKSQCSQPPTQRQHKPCGATPERGRHSPRLTPTGRQSLRNRALTRKPIRDHNRVCKQDSGHGPPRAWPDVRFCSRVTCLPPPPHALPRAPSALSFLDLVPMYFALRGECSGLCIHSEVFGQRMSWSPNKIGHVDPPFPRGHSLLGSKTKRLSSPMSLCVYEVLPLFYADLRTSPGLWDYYPHPRGERTDSQRDQGTSPWSQGWEGRSRFCPDGSQGLQACPTQVGAGWSRCDFKKEADVLVLGAGSGAGFGVAGSGQREVPAGPGRGDARPGPDRGGGH